jgi:hypothetical protein
MVLPKMSMCGDAVGKMVWRWLLWDVVATRLLHNALSIEQRTRFREIVCRVGARRNHPQAVDLHEPRKLMGYRAQRLAAEHCLMEH